MHYGCVGEVPWVLPPIPTLNQGVADDLCLLFLFPPPQPTQCFLHLQLPLRLWLRQHLSVPSGQKLRLRLRQWTACNIILLSDWLTQIMLTSQPLPLTLLLQRTLWKVENHHYRDLSQTHAEPSSQKQCLSLGYH